MTTLQQWAESDTAPWTKINEAISALSAAGIYSKRAPATTGLTWGFHGGLYNGATIADGTVTLTNAATNYVVVLRSSGVVSTSTSSANSVNPLYAKLYTLTTAGSVVTVEVDSRWDANGLLFNASGSAGTVTSVDAAGGVQTVAGSAITATGAIRAAAVFNAQTGTTYTVLTGDRGKLVTLSNAAAIAVTLPQAGASFPDGWYVDVKCIGAGTATITPTTSTIDGAASVALSTGQSLRIVSDGTNYRTVFNPATGGSRVGLAFEKELALSDLTTAITTGTTKAYFRPAFAATGVSARASLRVASSSGLPTVDVNKNAVTMMSTKLTIDASELTSVTAATPVVMSVTTWAIDDLIEFDIDVAGTGAMGLIVTVTGLYA